MKIYLFQVLCIAACLAMLKWRAFPGWGAIIIAGLIILFSFAATYSGEKNAAESMWWRFGIAILAPLIIGLAGA